MKRLVISGLGAGSVDSVDMAVDITELKDETYFFRGMFIVSGEIWPDLRSSTLPDSIVSSLL